MFLRVEGLDLPGQPQTELCELERGIGPECVILPCSDMLVSECQENHFGGEERPRCRLLCCLL